jgi:hypothetical protein
VRASATSRPGAPRAVELSVEAGEGVTVRYTLRLPAGDFLEKRTTTGHSVEVLRVDGETCEPALAVCVPRRLVLERDGEPLGVTTLERVELNPALPESTFTLEAPPGYAREQHELAEP